MKIAQIASPWIAIPPKNYGGTENVLYTLVEEQVAQGHKVTLFAPGDAKTSAELISFFPKSLLAAGESWQAHLKAYYHFHCTVEYLQEHKFDVVHMHLSSAADLYLFPLLDAINRVSATNGLNRVPAYVTTLHSPFPFDTVSRSQLGKADEYYMPWLAKVPMVAISESAQARAPQGLNFVGVVHHGLPLNDFRPTRRRRGDFLVWLGRFAPEKGAHLAIEAAKQAQVPLVLAGTIDRYRQESMHYFHERIEPHIDNEQVKYVGPVNLKQKRSLLSRARGFLNPIEWEEHFGMVMIEAMAFGCPVISFTRGAAPEIVVDGKTGCLVRNVDEMVQSIPRIDEIDREATRAHVEEHFSARVMAKNYTKIYKQLMKMNRAAQALHPHIDTALAPIKRDETVVRQN